MQVSLQRVRDYSSSGATVRLGRRPNLPDIDASSTSRLLLWKSAVGEAAAIESEVDDSGVAAAAAASPILPLSSDNVEVF